MRAFSQVGETGFEPATARPPAGCATRLRHSPICRTERATGIEPALEAWKASVQPQHFARSEAWPMIPAAEPTGVIMPGGGLGRALSSFTGDDHGAASVRRSSLHVKDAWLADARPRKDRRRTPRRRTSSARPGGRVRVL